MINICYNYYIGENSERNEELEYCLKKLYKNRNIDEFHIFIKDLDIKFFNKKFRRYSSKTKIHTISRPTYKDFFAISNSYNEDDISIIINSDCFINQNDTRKLKSMKKNDFYALSRHDIIDIDKFTLGEKHILVGSQDCWIFRGKIKENIKSDFFLGYAGCDHVIAYQLKLSGYNLINCPYNIKIYHYHLSEIDRKKLWNEKHYRYMNYSFVDIIKDDKIIEVGSDYINEKIRKSAYFFWNEGTNFSFLRYLTLYTFRLNHPSWEMILYIAKADRNKKWDGYERQDFITNGNKEDFINKLSEIDVKIEKINEYSHLNPVHISDIYRWDMLVNNEGGWYFDTDQVFLKSFDDLCVYDFVYGSESYFGIGVLGFSKSSKIPSYFQKLVHEKINDKLDDYTMIGNALFARTISYDETFKTNLYSQENVFKTPDKYFYPIFDSRDSRFIYDGIFDFFEQKNSYAIHWYGGHPISQEFNKKYTSKDYEIGEDSISKYLREIKFNINESFENNLLKYNEYKSKYEFIPHIPIKDDSELIKKTPSPPPLPPPPPPPKLKSNREICDEFLNGYQPFQIFYNNSLMFDSTSTDKRNLYFFEDGFSLYGRMFSYQGMRIMLK